MREIELRCPAKVNYFLEVLGRRDDGFHEIETLMQPVGLYDSIVFRKKSSGIDVRCDCPLIPSGEKNIVFKAVRLLAERAGFRGGVEVNIKKEIPAGSGLGGGSSDAAAAFAAVNALFGLGLGREDFYPMGREIGSDVAFFIRILDKEMTGFSGGAFIGRGRGDELRFAGALSGVWLVIVFPGFSVSTAGVYGALSLTEDKRDIKMIAGHVKGGNPAGVSECLFNRLEAGVTGRHPLIKDIKEDLLRAGARGALMTGSGSAVFGLAPDRETACVIREKILADRKEVNAYVTCAL